MMRQWGPRSSAVYRTLDPRMQAVCDDILQHYMDISLIKGHRGEAEQNAAFAAGHSKLQWPNGKHNRDPSLAVDAQPFPLPSGEDARNMALGYMGACFVLVGEKHGLKIRWGGDWNRDGSTADTKFLDAYHAEIVE